ncbi:MAG: hypothetical protein ACO3CM_03470 [Candidatus Limnocylindrus sp.]
MSDKKSVDPRDPRRGLRGLDVPAIPGSEPPDPERAAEQERRGLFGVKLIVGGLVGTAIIFTILDIIAQRLGG